MDRYHTNLCSGRSIMPDKGYIDKYISTYLLCIYCNTLFWLICIDLNTLCHAKCHTLICNGAISVHSDRLWLEISQDMSLGISLLLEASLLLGLSPLLILWVISHCGCYSLFLFGNFWSVNRGKHNEMVSILPPSRGFWQTWQL